MDDEGFFHWILFSRLQRFSHQNKCAFTVTKEREIEIFNTVEAVEIRRSKSLAVVWNHMKQLAMVQIDPESLAMVGIDQMKVEFHMEAQ